MIERRLQITNKPEERSRHLSTIAEDPSWYVIQTHPKQENRAEANLNFWQVETFFPKMRESRLDRVSRTRSWIIKPLFTTYMFARFSASQMLHKICFTRGVRKVVSVNGHPQPVSREIINLIRSRVSESGFVRIGESFRSGDKVVIKNGPLKELIGILEEDFNDDKRVSVLLAAVNYQTRVVIDKELIQKVV